MWWRLQHEDKEICADINSSLWRGDIENERGWGGKMYTKVRKTNWKRCMLLKYKIVLVYEYKTRILKKQAQGGQLHRLKYTILGVLCCYLLPILNIAFYVFKLRKTSSSPEKKQAFSFPKWKNQRQNSDFPIRPSKTHIALNKQKLFLVLIWRSIMLWFLSADISLLNYITSPFRRSNFCHGPGTDGWLFHLPHLTCLICPAADMCWSVSPGSHSYYCCLFACHKHQIILAVSVRVTLAFK